MKKIKTLLLNNFMEDKIGMTLGAVNQGAVNWLLFSGWLKKDQLESESLTYDSYEIWNNYSFNNYIIIDFK